MIIYKKAKCRIHGEKPVKDCMHCGYACGWNDYRKLMLKERLEIKTLVYKLSKKPKCIKCGRSGIALNQRLCIKCGYDYLSLSSHS